MSSIEELKRYIEFLSTTDIEEIEIQSLEGEKIFLKRERKPAIQTSLAPQAVKKDNIQNLSKEQTEVSKDNLVDANRAESLVEEFTVRSPMVGKFLLSVSQDHPPIVMEGSHVKQGQKIAIIETMRILRDVVSPKEGVVKKILVKDGEFVEYGQPLIVLEVKKGEK